MSIVDVTTSKDINSSRSTGDKCKGSVDNDKKADRKHDEAIKISVEHFQANFDEQVKESHDVYQERIKEYAIVNKARIVTRNARIEYIKCLQNFTEKISAFDKKYNANEPHTATTANFWQDALDSMQCEQLCTQNIEYDFYLQVRIEIDALQKAREEYQAWISAFDEQSKFCCSRCRKSLGYLQMDNLDDASEKRKHALAKSI